MTATSAGETSAALAAREAAIERTGWGSGFSLWQPRNACFWVYLGVVGYGFWYAFGLVNSQVRVYGPALAASALIFAVYGLLFWWFTARIDRYSRQPLGLVIAAFVWGGFGATWTIALSGNTSLMSLYQKLFGQDFVLDWGAGLSAPFFEELGKGAGVLLLLFLAPRVVRTAYDGFILGAFVGLGFEIVEDILYALQSAPDEFGSHQLATSLHTVVLRLLTGFSSHILYSAVFCAGLLYLVGTAGQRRRPGLGLTLMLTAMVMHLLWDSTVVLSGGNGVIVIALIVGITLAAFAVVITVFRLAVRPEREAMRAVMAPEAEAGALTSEELDALAGGWKERRRYRAAGGIGDRRRRRHRLEAAHDLADEIAAAGGHDTGRVQFVRSELARLAQASQGRP
ncbi:PrsW family intramembrane metalloprotease [Dactylosporangium sp. AC04546]|uniref:PrsW family intramembrane metalloprotease n=1 Tax=Dactylosporangium sp. AC04546 TaxID=2862460 RepID=UPI001EE0CAF4|nr:PrsW family intramembrane metalloprotease [Dactylosporangium sp. AC04546]WVK86761.1 PrsW family intramembrane metalloprotease [Dactylosporangium sp. AC04546]